MIKKSLLILSLLLAKIAFAQQPTPADGRLIEGTVKDKVSGKAMPGVTVSLLNPKDSSAVEVAATDSLGTFHFHRPGDAVYILRSTHSGYSTEYIHWDLAAHPGAGGLVILLQTKSLELKDILINSPNPLIQRNGEKMIFNVEKNIQTNGLSALEIMPFAPGLSTDKETFLKLNGKSNVLVLIDGKQQFINTDDAIRYIKNMPADQISRLEIISNPSAKYDGNATGGVINIVTKRNPAEGLNGTLRLTTGAGQYSYRLKEGGSFNYRKGNFNLYGGVDLTNNKTRSFNEVTQDWTSQQALFSSNQTSNPKTNQIDSRIGADWKLSKNSVLGVLLSGGWSSLPMTSATDLSFYQNGALIGSGLMDENRQVKNQDYTANVNYKQSFKKPGETLEGDFTYIKKMQDYQDLFNQTSDQNEIFSNYLLRNDLHPNTDLLTGKIDYRLPLSKTWVLETGIKDSKTSIQNNTALDSLIGGNTKWYDHDISLLYNENVAGTYINITKVLHRLTLVAGTRLEYTTSTGKQDSDMVSFDNHYLQLFPSFSAQYGLKDHQLSLSLNKKASRPWYDQLNPFVQYSDQFTYFQGNPNLQPAGNYTAEISDVFKSRYMVTVGYNLVTNAIIQTYQKDPDNQDITKITYSNLGRLSGTYVALFVPVTINKWWSLNINSFMYYLHYSDYPDSIYPNVNKGPLSVNTTLYSTIKLPYKMSFVITASGTSNQRINQNYVDGYTTVDMALSRSILNNKGTLSFQVNDVFNTYAAKGTTEYLTNVNTFDQKLDTRIFRLAFRYSFGKSTVSGARQRQLGSDADKMRLEMDHAKYGTVH